jgi:hypothetical protein
VAALVVVFASLTLNPRASEAACGDYVQITGGTRTSADLMSDHAMNADGNPVDSTRRGAPRRPCRGPGCSNGSLPPAAPVPTVEVSVERWALAATDLLPIVDSSYYLLAEPANVVLAGFRLSILRPPR